MKNLNNILKILLALAFLGAGLLKLFKPYEELIADPELGWATEFSPSTILIIGALEVFFALGIVLPSWFKKMQMLTPISSICLSVIMIGAAYTHLQRDEPIIQNIVLLGFTLIVTWLNLGYLKTK